MRWVVLVMMSGLAACATISTHDAPVQVSRQQATENFHDWND